MPKNIIENLSYFPNNERIAQMLSFELAIVDANGFLVILAKSISDVRAIFIYLRATFGF